MTIQEATQYCLEQLSETYEEGESANISGWIMEHLTGLKKTGRFLKNETTLPIEQVLQLKGYIERLKEHEPIQYVLNEAWFYGLKFYVDQNVLIPRPETEELVEWIITDCKFPINELKILDIGSGSGCIPVALKRKLRKAEVWSCDISEAALKVAKKNADTLGAIINFLLLDILNKEQRERLPSFDIIVSNPPYIPQKERYQMRPNVLEYEPARALFVPDNDPLIFYKAIADFGKTHLNKKGTIYAEIHEDIGEVTSKLFQTAGFTTTIQKDMQGKERMIKAENWP